MKKVARIVPLLFLLVACGDKKILKTEVQIITVKNSASNIDDFKKLVEPFECESDKDNINVCYPLHLIRIDIENSNLKMDYLNNKAVNYEKIAPVKRDFIKYFKNEFSDTIFSTVGTIEPSFEEYLNSANCFVYASNTKGIKMLGAKKIYDDATELRTDMANYTQKNKGKIIIIYNPVLQADLNQVATTKSTDQLTPKTSATPSSTVLQKEQTPAITSQQVAASSIEEYFQKLADRNIPYNSKQNLLNSIAKFCVSSSTKVVSVNNNGDVLFELGSIGDYAEKLTSTHKKVYIIDKDINGGKISLLKVQEQ